MKRLDVVWLERRGSERVSSEGPRMRAPTSILEEDCGGTTQTAKNLILSTNEKFLRSCESHVTGNGDHVPWFRFVMYCLPNSKSSVKLILSVSEWSYTMT